MANAADWPIFVRVSQVLADVAGVTGTERRIRPGAYAPSMERDDAHVEQDPARDDFELLCRLVKLGRDDRERYRKFRALMWALYVENSGCSDKPSESS
jgi:hypothetical protein